jgi:putative membrane protein
MRFLIRTIITALAVWVAAIVLRGITVTGSSWWRNALTLLCVAVIIGLINTFLKPVIKVLGCPLYILTLGLISFVINALLLWLASWIAGELNLPFHVTGFWTAFWGAIIIAFVSWLLSLALPDGNRERDRRQDSR